MPYITLSGISTYYEVTGEGQPLIVLHGGFCSIETMRAQIDELAAHFTVFAPERAGQGRTADRDGPITFDLIVSDTLAFLDAMDLDSVHILGFSDGAIAGLLLARDHGARVRSLIAIGANLDPGGLTDEKPDERQTHHDEAGAALDLVLRSDYERLSPDGPAHAPVILEKLARLWKTEPHIAPGSLSTISVPTMVMAGDHDSIRVDHTVTIAASIPNAELCIVPGAGHLVMLERPRLVSEIANDFFVASLRQQS